jgi:hypothetical protein
MSYEDELRKVLDETANEVSDAYGNPRSWLSWIVYLLSKLEQKATDEDPVHKESYKEMLAALQDQIRNRLKTGGW